MRDTDRALPIALLRAREATMRSFRGHLDQHGVTPEQWRVIRELAEDGALTAGELSERCGLMPPSLSRILKALETRGLLQRVADGDGRRKRVDLTAEGRAVFDGMSVTAEAIYARIEAAYGRDRMDTLLDLLIELRSAIESVDDVVLDSERASS